MLLVLTHEHYRPGCESFAGEGQSPPFGEVCRWETRLTAVSSLARKRAEE